MKWCFFSPGDRSFRVLSGDTRDAGGAQAQIACLASLLVDRSEEVTLLYGAGESVRESAVRGVRCIRAAPEWRNPASLQRFWDTLISVSPDIFYARLPSDFLWMIGAAARWTGAQFFYALASDEHSRPFSAYHYKRLLHGALYAAGLASAHRILVQHLDQRPMLRTGLRERTLLVPNVFMSDRTGPRPFSATTFDAVWVAVIRPVKQLEIYLELARSLPDMRFAVIGGFDPEATDQYRTIITSLIATCGNVAYFGPLDRDRVLSVMHDSRVLVCTSLVEGFPNTMLEAWSLGVPVASLEIDPGGVIAKHGLGRVSATRSILRSDILALARCDGANTESGDRAFSYVRQQHSPETVLAALAPATAGSPCGRQRSHL